MKKGWETTWLGEVCTVQSGTGFPKKFQGHRDEEYPFFKVSDMNLPGNEIAMRLANNYVSESVRNELGARVFPIGSVVFPKVGGAIATNKKRQVAQDCCVDNNIMGLVPLPNRIMPAFLRYKMMSLDIYEFSNKSNPPSIRQQTVQSWPIDLPPLAEQGRIVAILDEACEGIGRAIANAEKNLANARELLDSYLNAVFTTQVGDWKTCQLAELLERITYGFTNPMPTSEVGPYMVTAKNVNEGRILYEQARRTTQAAFDELLTDKSRPKAGDLLLTKDGTLGRLAVVDTENICINQSVAVLRPNTKVDPHFLKYLLSSPEYQRQMIKDSGGTTIKHIYITRVDKMDVNYPSRKEQEKIVANSDRIFQWIKDLVLQYEAKLDALAELNQSLLQKAFSGELTSQPDQAPEEAVA